MMYIKVEDVENFTELGQWIIKQSGLTPYEFLTLDEAFNDRLSGKNKWRNPINYTNKKMKRLLTGTDEWMPAELQLLAELADVEFVELMDRFKKYVYGASPQLGIIMPAR